MKRALALQLLHTTRLNLEAVSERVEAVQADVFTFDDDETIGPSLASQIDNLYDRALEARRRTEHLDPFETEQPDDD